MITAGVDVGNKYTKVVILKENVVTGKGIAESGFDQKKAVEEALSESLKVARLQRENLQFVLATKSGVAEVPFANGTITDISAAARGVFELFPNARTVADVGSEQVRVLKMDDRGRVVDFTINDKCAAGTGSFLEAMCDALETPLEEMGPLSLKSEKAVPMNAQCAVFAESEVISLIHARTPKTDIARAIHDAMASRISSMVRRVGLQQEVVLIGGVAHNPGFVKSMEEDLGITLLLPDDPEYVSALGAAIAAAEKAGQPNKTR